MIHREQKPKRGRVGRPRLYANEEERSAARRQQQIKRRHRQQEEQKQESQQEEQKGEVVAWKRVVQVSLHATTRREAENVQEVAVRREINVETDERAGGAVDAAERERERTGATRPCALRVLYPTVAVGVDEARVRIKAVGICGSDVHYLKHMRCGDFIVKEPMVIGHECAGIIEEIGSNVKHLAVGDRVALEPGISCSQCKTCKEGFYNLCSEMKFFATPPVHGSLANRVVHPASLCFKLPENVSLEEGAMCEPLSVGVHACRRAAVGAETNVMIFGAGPIGLVCMLVARAFGSPRIILVDLDEHRLDVAKQLGADGTLLVSSDSKDIAAEVLKLKELMGDVVDASLDCAGYGKTMDTALKVTRAGGVVCLIGMAQNEMNLALTAAAAREVTILGVFRFGFSQEDAEKAFATSASGGNAIKVMFNL